MSTIGSGTIGSGTMGDPTGSVPVRLGAVSPALLRVAAPPGSVEALVIDRSSSGVTLTLLDDNLVRTQPGSVRVALGNGTPGQSVTLTLDGSALLTATLDDHGRIPSLVVPIADVAAGSHLLDLARPVSTTSSGPVVLASRDDPDPGIWYAPMQIGTAFAVTQTLRVSRVALKTWSRFPAGSPIILGALRGLNGFLNDANITVLGSGTSGAATTGIDFVAVDLPAAVVLSPGTTYILYSAAGDPSRRLATATAPTETGPLAATPLCIVRPDALLTDSFIPFELIGTPVVAPTGTTIVALTGAAPTAVEVVPELPPATPVNRWTLQSAYRDDFGQFETYTLPRNPNHFDQKFGSLAVSSAPTATGSRIVSWEGAPVANQWTFSGHVLDQGEYDALRAWGVGNRRVWLTTHFNERFLVTVSDISFQRVRDPARPWHQTYTMTVYVMEGPGVIS